MRFGELYKYSIDRRVNPAVSASDLDDDTVSTEIDEYVFTQDIIVNLYNILANIKQNQGSHVGIWINGYYGSGKSHFLKYASYCLSFKKEYRERAFSRLIEATEEFLLKKNDDEILAQGGVSLSELNSLYDWYINKADVEMILFNIGDVHNANADERTTFTTIFWNRFNALRGYNSTYLSLAQYLEKALDNDGKLQKFKLHVEECGYDWERNIVQFAGSKLDLALQMAKEVDQELSTDAIRANIINNTLDVSVESFAAEIKEYLDRKNNRNHRILFFVDEVSQFIGEHRNLLLQLQSLVERLGNVCESRVWIACTAQQTLDEVVRNIGNTSNPEDEVGKIMGRFEVRTSLQGTSPEYITQKRILDKTLEAEGQLAALYNANKSKYEAQFILPATYRAYDNSDDFAAFYPFVPYQFQLIMRVLDSFVNMGYVDRQVKGNERSLINITYSIVRKTKDWTVGDFVPFDSFFGAMIRGSMQHNGLRAIQNANDALGLIQDKEKRAFYQRVVYVLFMICNLSDSDKPSFAATIDNVATLLMTKTDANRSTIKNNVAEVLTFLIENSVIRRFTKNDIEIYEFFTEEEANVARIIKNIEVDSNTYAEELKNMIHSYFNLSNKKNYITRSFSVGGNVYGKHFLANNADVEVDFVITADADSPEEYALNNDNRHLVFFLCHQFNENKELCQNFYYYCQVQRFMQEPTVSEERQKTKRIFQERARDIYDRNIKPKFQGLLDTCPVISAQHILPTSVFGNVKRQERYERALDRHLSQLYPYATLVEGQEIPKTRDELKGKMLRQVEPTLAEQPFSEAENKVNEFLNRQQHDVTVEDVISKFANPPYGWSDIATIYVINELVRRHTYVFSYNNTPNVSLEYTASKILSEASRFTIEKAQAISQDVLNSFVEAWKYIFNLTSVGGGNDSAELFRYCKENNDSELYRRRTRYRELFNEIKGYAFKDVVENALNRLEKWTQIRDPLNFFNTIINEKDDAAKLFDQCEEVRRFHEDQFDLYKKIIYFADDNKDNFSFLPQEQQLTATSLRAIHDDKEPWKALPRYNKMKRSLACQLTEHRKALIEEIKNNYNAVFDELEKYAESIHVGRDKFANREETISQKTGSENFHVLKDNADTSAFRTEQLRLINEARPSDAPQRKCEAVSLKTRTTVPMSTETDVDDYLAGLKRQLMKYIDSGTDVVIN